MPEHDVHPEQEVPVPALQL